MELIEKIETLLKKHGYTQEARTDLIFSFSNSGTWTLFELENYEQINLLDFLELLPPKPKQP